MYCDFESHARRPDSSATFIPADRIHYLYVITHGVPPTTGAASSHRIENERILITRNGTITV